MVNRAGRGLPLTRRAGSSSCGAEPTSLCSLFSGVAEQVRLPAPLGAHSRAAANAGGADQGHHGHAAVRRSGGHRHPGSVQGWQEMGFPLTPPSLPRLHFGALCPLQPAREVGLGRAHCPWGHGLPSARSPPPGVGTVQGSVRQLRPDPSAPRPAGSHALVPVGAEGASCRVGSQLILVPWKWRICVANTCSFPREARDLGGSCEHPSFYMLATDRGL